MLKFNVMEDLEGEIWKPIIYKGVDYTGHYEVSNMGRVRSVKFGFRIRKSSISTSGYCGITLFYDGSQKSMSVHSLVISSFCRDITEKEVVDHINSNKIDNRLINLRILEFRLNCSRERVAKSNLPCGVILNNSIYFYFMTRIRINTSFLYLGNYKDENKAKEAYEIALKCHNEGYDLLSVINLVDEYRISIGLKPIKRKINA